MKKRLFLLLALPLLLAGCGKSGEKNPKAPFAVPVVDVDSLQITLPPMTTWDTTSPVKNDGTYDIIDIYEVSDMHAMIDYANNGEKSYWGFSGMANFFNEKRSENKGTIVVSSGDMWQGGCESNLTRGRVVAECMRYVGFEAMALGNHEFDWGEEVLQHNSTYFTADMPLLCGNLVDKRTDQRPSYVGTSKIIQRGGYKVGVIGTIGEKIDYAIAKSVFANFKLNNASAFASQEAQRLKESENCDIVVWITHEDAVDAVLPEYVDALFGGHTHKNKLETTEGPTVGHTVPRVETQNYGDSIAHVEFKIDSTKKVVSATGEFLRAVDHTSYLKDEANVKNLIDQYKNATNEVKSYKLNKVAGEFKASNHLGNLSCKAMFEEFNDGSVFAALQNGDGGVRIDLQPGVVTYGDIYTGFPFDNEVVYFTKKGSEIKDFCEAYFSGLNKYVNVLKYSELDPNKEYKIITTDFVCTNKLDMTEDKFTPIAGSVIRDVVAKYIYNTNGLKAEDFAKSLPNYKNPK